MATLTIADLDNGKRDLQTVDEVANSRAATATTRFGQQTTTLYEAIRRINAEGDAQLAAQDAAATELILSLGFRVPIPYESGLDVSDSRFTVSGPDGKVYAPLSTPFTTGAWDPSQWYVLQNDLNDKKLLIFDTLPAAQAAAATLPDGQIVDAMDVQERYKVQGGSLVVVSKFGERSRSLAGSNLFQSQSIYQNNAATPFGLLIKPNAGSSLDGEICQDMVYDRVTPALYATWSTPEGTVISEHSSIGEFRKQSAPVTGTGHGQGFGMFYDELGAVTLVMESGDRKGVTFFNPMAVDGGSVVNPRTFLLNPDWTIVYPAVSASGEYLSAVVRLSSVRAVVRGYSIREMLQEGGGDFSNRHFFEFPLLPDADYGASNVLQGIADGGEFIYILTGNSGQENKKFLSCFNKLSGERIYRVEIVTGKALAQARNATTYELEGLEWVANAAGNHSLWTVVVVRRSGGVGYDMVAAPIDARGFGSVGSVTPLGGGGYVSSAQHDVLLNAGGRYSVARQSGLDAGAFPELWAIGGDDRVYSNLRHRLGAGAVGGIVPESSVNTGIEIKPDLGRMSLGGSTVALQSQRPSDGPLHQFYQNSSYVGSIAVTATATAYNTTSDATMKIDFGLASAEEAVERVKSWRIRNYKWKTTGENDRGFFAQELYETNPEAVTAGGNVQNEEGETEYQPWGVDRSRLVDDLALALQYALKRIEQLESK